MKRLERYKTDVGKRKGVQRKINRAEEQELRKKYVKSCRIRQTYGEEEESNVLEEEAVLLAENAVRNGVEQGTAPQIPDHEVDAPESAEVTLGGTKCKWCGSTTHSRKMHKDCPRNPKIAPNSTSETCFSKILDSMAKMCFAKE
ncbi:hypothetical protein OS493_000400 [Desmophyllum pertusum]|uniref:Uncharacterized protein n=1 Tax=Desmophyllum pertusum TaxID=174260 RepID=A0A9X0A751_9CNID|nr:hypothetical protein OS493_000400 [Desmophyllum pertusum]